MSKPIIDPLGFATTINWDAVEENLTEIAAIFEDEES